MDGPGRGSFGGCTRRAGVHMGVGGSGAGRLTNAAPVPVTFMLRTPFEKTHIASIGCSSLLSQFTLEHMFSYPLASRRRLHSAGTIN